VKPETFPTLMRRVLRGKGGTDVDIVQHHTPAVGNGYREKKEELSEGNGEALHLWLGGGFKRKLKKKYFTYGPAIRKGGGVNRSAVGRTRKKRKKIAGRLKLGHGKGGIWAGCLH